MRRLNRFAWIGASLLLWLAAAEPADAQVGAAALTGTVRDESGAAVPGATVTATSLATRQSRTAVSDPDGGYFIPNLAPGTYQIRVEMNAFRPVAREGVRLATGETIRLDFQLQLGGLTEAITVTADAPLLRSTAGGLGQVIDNRKIVDLPLNGRSFITFAGLAPGVALPPGSSLPRINGGRPRTTTPFGPPNGVQGSPAFGTITTAGDPRVVQLALKLLF